MDIYQEIEAIKEQLNRIETLLEQEKGDKKLTPREAADYLNISLSRLYKLTSTRRLPFYKPGGKMLYFYQSELDEYIRNGKCKTIREIDKEAINFMFKRQ